MDKRIATGIVMGLAIGAGGTICFADSIVGKDANPTTNLNLRNINNDSVITTLKTYNTVRILEDLGNGFVKVKTESGKVGKCAKNYLKVKNVTNTNVNTASKTGTVNTDGLKFRRGAGSNFSVIRTLSKGTTVTMYEESYGWRKVKVGNEIGWCADRYISSAGSTVTTNTSSTNNASNVKYTTKQVKGTNSLNVRSGPGTNYSKIGTLSLNTKVDVISSSNKWSKIKFNSRIAYVHESYLGDVSTNTSQIKKQFNNTVSKYTTSYKRTGKYKNRAINVELAAAKINRVVIKKGQSISFKDLIGPITKTNGYVEAPVMSGGKITGNGIGGGVCQVSSTLYNAALYAGLTDIESKNHSGIVSYTPAGTDAVISDWQDLKIRNTYNEDIMIEASCSNGNISVSIKSVNPLLGGKIYETKTTSSKSGLTVKLELIEKKNKKDKGRVVYTRLSDYVR